VPAEGALTLGGGGRRRPRELPLRLDDEVRDLTLLAREPLFELVELLLPRQQAFVLDLDRRHELGFSPGQLLLAGHELVLALIELTLACAERLLAAEQELPASLQELELLLELVVAVRLRRGHLRPQVDDTRFVVVGGILVFQWRHGKALYGIVGAVPVPRIPRSGETVSSCNREASGKDIGLPGRFKKAMEAASVPWRPIGELFLTRGHIDEAQLEEALAEQAATGARLGEILVKRKLISSTELTTVLMEQLGREVAREDGFGSGLWAVIARRNARAEVAEPKPGVHEPLISLAREDYGEEFEPPPVTLGEALRNAREAPPDQELQSLDVDLTVSEAELEELRSELGNATAGTAEPGSQPDAADALAAHETERALEFVQGERDAAVQALEEVCAALRAAEARIGELESGIAQVAAQSEQTRGAAEEDARVERKINRLRRKLDNARAKRLRVSEELDQARREAGELVAAQALAAELQDRLSASDARVAELELQARSLDDELSREDVAELDRLRNENAVLAAQRDEAREEPGLRLAAAESRLAEESASHVETRRVLSQALDELAELRPSPWSDLDPRADCDYLLFAPGGDGYRLVPRTGAVPELGGRIELDAADYVVTRVGRSPLPFDSRRCVYLQAVGSYD
jgi:hypothetical protein